MEPFYLGAVCFVVMLLIVVAIMASDDETSPSGTSCFVALTIFLCWVFGFDYESSEETIYEERVKTIVSTKSFNGQSGNISGAFGFISGTFEGRVYYVLRVKENGRYEDLTVKNGAYLVVDESLTDTGKFVQKVKRVYRKETYSIFGAVVSEKEGFDDWYDSVREQTIVLPKEYIEIKLNKI